ncbi:uncharacterized protein LOC117239771 [Bombus vosnesenskii]|uniref:Uncharacterized protein LOC117239771 n=1 Tax=Bombus vosnesenskii TaxID=207650 RepID=A0A6J3LA23_9HYME|nr:uncharacterized protein LOC117239771 [Bombus vosnesenskii]
MFLCSHNFTYQHSSTNGIRVTWKQQGGRRTYIDLKVIFVSFKFLLTGLEISCACFDFEVLKKKLKMPLYKLTYFPVTALAEPIRNLQLCSIAYVSMLECKL